MQRLSILSLFLLTAYFAVCALVYASRNPTIGWLIVVATAVVIGVITFRAYQTRNVFGLRFSAVASLCLPLTLGFVVETPSTTTKLVDLGTPIWKLMNLGRTFRQLNIEEYATFEQVAEHDLYTTHVHRRLPDDVGVPGYRNALRLAACWSALSVGVIAGIIVSLATRRDRRPVNLPTDAGEPRMASTRPRSSVTFALLTLGYLAICGLNYVSENATFGWFFVIATAALMSVSLIGAFQKRSRFKLGFAILGSLWLASTLGFALETPVDAPLYDLRTPVWNALSFGRGPMPPIEDYRTLRMSNMHDLFASIGRARLPHFREIPDIGNTMRLAACWSAILVGLVGGIGFFLIEQVSSQSSLVRHAT